MNEKERNQWSSRLRRSHCQAELMMLELGKMNQEKLDNDWKQLDELDEQLNEALQDKGIKAGRGK